MRPSLLIASPQMRDGGIFERTVVLLWHHEEDGAAGVVVNKPLTHLLPDVLELPRPIDLTDYASTRVAWGGPVDTNSGTVLTTRPVPLDEGWNLDGIGVSHSMDVLLGLLEQRAPLVLCLGYAGWGPGQLEDELQRGSWLWTDLDPRLVFECPYEERYDRALASLGLTPADVWMTPIDE